MPRIVYVMAGDADRQFAESLVPHGFELVEVKAGSPELEAAMPEADYLVGLGDRSMDDKFYARAKKLRLVQLLSAGYDKCDIEAARRAGIPICNNGGANSVAVAEHTLMLMLAVARQAARQDAAVRSGEWNIRNRFETVELDGKTLLLLGFGRIGRRVAELAQAFGMAVTAHDPYVKPDVLARHRVRPAPDLAKALAEADYLSLHMPGSAGGPLIGEKELGLMKPSAILVNAARGGLVDETALDAALRAGRLYGAGLDVLETEPPPASHPLLSNERVLISPHGAGLTAECAARMAVASVQNVIDHFAGKLDPGLVVNAAAIG